LEREVMLYYLASVDTLDLWIDEPNLETEAIPQELRNALMEVMKKLTSKVLKIR
jgi:hypothetical protein